MEMAILILSPEEALPASPEKAIYGLFWFKGNGKAGGA
jgi:hypothetical protein